MSAIRLGCGRGYVHWALVASTLWLASIGMGCSASSGRGGRRYDAGPFGRFDAGPHAGNGDGGVGVDHNAPPVNPCVPGCGPTELCGDRGDGNGLDDDCNGQVDETCSCRPGETRPCFAGPPDRRQVGACADGIETCNEFMMWSACVGGISATDETCDGQDNDCDGVTDEDVPGCRAAVMCPSSENSPPLSTYAMRGERVYPGTGSNWHWEIQCPASVPAALCPHPRNPETKDTDVYFTASGAYRVLVTLRTDDGEAASCAWTVYVQGGGLRVELNWDTMLDTAGGTDVDLHLHRWTSDSDETTFFDRTDDCYYTNCQPDDRIAWSGHGDSPLSNCQDAPHGGGATWRSVGTCRNPRLDVDTNGTDGPCRGSVTDPNSNAFCAPENINVDNPIIGMPYRILVNYYNDSGYDGETHPTVNVYCGGALRASFGADPIVTLRNGSDFGAANDNWYVADVVFVNGTCGVDCIVYPLGNVATGDFFGAPFGAQWSCRYDESARQCTAR